MLSVSAGKEITSNSAGVSENYNGIDLVKFICAILVFCIHIAPFQEHWFPLAKYLNFGLQKCVCRLAVPFFFVSSGFFLFRKMELYDLKIDVIKNYCFKILQLLGIWRILLFIGDTGHLWYLGATVIAIPLLSLCLHSRIKFIHISILAVLLYCIGLLGDSYFGFVEPLMNIKFFKYAFKGYELFFETTRNGIFMGFIFVLMGASFAHFKIRMKKKTALIGFVASMLCLFVEVFALKRYSNPYDWNMYVFLLPAVFFLFHLACSIKLNDHWIYKKLRGIGVLFYFLHLTVNCIVGLGIRYLKQFFGIACAPYQFIITFLVAFALAILIEHLSHKETFKWLKWLY